MTVREAKQRINSAEFTDWMAFASHEPIGQDRHDLLTGLVCSVLDSGFYLVAKASGAKFSSPRDSTSPADFVPKWWEKPKPTIQTTQTVEEQKFIFDLFFNSMKEANKSAA